MTEQEGTTAVPEREQRSPRVPWRFEPRQGAGGAWVLLWIVVAIVAALVISSLLLLVAHVDVPTAYGALFVGAFGSQRALLQTLLRASTLILTGLSAAVAFRAKIWNIGQEGQLIAGGVGAFWAFTLFSGLPRPLLFLLVLLFALASGALLGGLTGLLKTRFRVDEIISTMMLNYIMLYFVAFIVSSGGPWKEPTSAYQQSILIPAALRFPKLVPASGLHIGLLVSLAAAVAVKILLDRTPLGFEIRALGLNPAAARFKGTNVPATIIIVMLLSGGLAGLAGAGELFGVQYRLVLDLAGGLGYTGIIVAMLANLDPLGVVLAAILFGGLTNGAYKLQTTTGVSSSIIEAIQAIVLLCVLAAFVFSRYRLKRISYADPATADSHPR
jgi:general nucleoside transport system permease protein